jgi:hypothetical protein
MLGERIEAVGFRGRFEEGADLTLEQGGVSGSEGDSAFAETEGVAADEGLGLIRGEMSLGNEGDDVGGGAGLALEDVGDHLGDEGLAYLGTGHSGSTGLPALIAVLESHARRPPEGDGDEAAGGSAGTAAAVWTLVVAFLFELLKGEVHGSSREDHRREDAERRDTLLGRLCRTRTQSRNQIGVLPLQRERRR